MMLNAVGWVPARKVHWVTQQNCVQRAQAQMWDDEIFLIISNAWVHT